MCIQATRPKLIMSVKVAPMHVATRCGRADSLLEDYSVYLQDGCVVEERVKAAVSCPKRRTRDLDGGSGGCGIE